MIDMSGMHKVTVDVHKKTVVAQGACSCLSGREALAHILMLPDARPAMSLLLRAKQNDRG